MSTHKNERTGEERLRDHFEVLRVGAMHTEAVLPKNGDGNHAGDSGVLKKAFALAHPVSRFCIGAT